MAADWIKMRSDLGTHPKVVRILSALKADASRTESGRVSDKLRVIGALHAVWSLFDIHSEDGRLEGYSAEVIDELIGFEGFAKAMISVGWLEQDAETLVMPRFDEHNGKSAKRRAQEAVRKREERNADKRPQDVQEMSASDADKMRTREEKRREEVKAEQRASRLPEDWVPSEDEIDFCKSERPDLNPRAVGEQFRDYWVAQPGAKGRKTDWTATWRNWVRNQRGKPMNGHSSGDSIFG